MMETDSRFSKFWERDVWYSVIPFGDQHIWSNV